MQIRLATTADAEQLHILNENFNGKGETTLSNIQQSLTSNSQEIVIVAEENKILMGFVCVQLKKSFCYGDYQPEITEVFVTQSYRRRKIATKMIEFAESYCKQNYSLHKFELLTGKQNLEAQALYKGLGYSNDGELHLAKRS